MQMDPAPTLPWSNRQTRAQFAAVAALRWRIWLNQFRRKGGGGEMVGRIFMGLIFAVFTLGMMSLAGSMALLAFETGHPGRTVFILWAAFLLCQFLNIQVGQPGTVFDPTQLIRFPMRVGTYVGIRLFFGMLAPSNIMIALVSLAIATGITIAQPTLWAYAFAALILFAITNALFSRMIFAWVDRWLSTRRSREVFTGFIFVAAMGFQYLNVTFNPGLNGNKHSAHPEQRVSAGVTLYHHAQPFLRPLPPELITRAVLAPRLGVFLMNCLGCGMFALLFYAVFAWRTRIEFRGEDLSNAANSVQKTKKHAIAKNAAPQLAPDHAAAMTRAQTGLFALNPTVGVVLHKELLQIRRNMGLFFGLIAPLFFVFLFAGRLNTHMTWVLPGALIYVMMGVATISYNAFGLEGVGTQFYFVAPVRMRDVFLAKNLVGFAIAAIDVVAVLLVLGKATFAGGASVFLACMLWVAATLLLTTTLGNRRSVTTPKKIETRRMASKQASQTSALLAFGILLGSAAVGGSLLLAGVYFHAQWVLVPVFAALTIGAAFVYRWGQNTIDAFTRAHREHLLEELAKKA